MADISLKDAFEIFAKNRDQILTMWNFYSVVTLGLVAWALGSDKLALGESQKIYIIVGFIAFAVGNAWAVVSSQQELIHMAAQLKKHAGSESLALQFVTEPMAVWKFITFYAVVTIVVSVAIWCKPAP